VPIQVGEARLTLMSFHATTPVFDGPEDRNGRRNHDEIVFWRHVLDGQFGPAPEPPFVIAGNANLDPVDGEGRKAAILNLLGDPRLQDPRPRGPPRDPGAPNTPGHAGDPTLDTVSWPVPGNLRVSYILPSAEMGVAGAGVHWPLDGPEADLVAEASRHRLIWVDVTLD
ncbi:MAG: endonuclease/exonuclease/phosphatase family protein, partial [Pseudomonadota bacterium]